MVKNVTIILLLLMAITGCEQDLVDDPVPWKYEQPQNLGANAGLLLKLDEDIRANEFGDVHSLMIIKNDKVIFENYYNGFSRKDLHPLNRASQSVLALVYEPAFADASLQYSDKIIDMFPEYTDIFDNIPQKDKIEIKHLIEQSSGFNWDEWNFTTLAEDNRAEDMEQADDWVRFALSTKMIREPGMDFNFNSGHSIILSAILEKRLEGTLKEYVAKKLFKPLDISSFTWEETPTKILNTASGLHMTTKDMCKLGYLMLNEGEWQGRSILTTQGINALNIPVANSDYYRVGKNWFRFNVFHPVVQSLRENDLFFTWGEGGQFIFVVPHLDLVVAITAGNYDNGQEFKLFYILKDYILPSFDNLSEQFIPFSN